MHMMYTFDQTTFVSPTPLPNTIVVTKRNKNYIILKIFKGKTY